MGRAVRLSKWFVPLWLWRERGKAPFWWVVFLFVFFLGPRFEKPNRLAPSERDPIQPLKEVLKRVVNSSTPKWDPMGVDDHSTKLFVVFPNGRGSKLCTPDLKNGGEWMFIHPKVGSHSFGAFCLAVRTLTFCQLMGFPLNH